MRRAGAAGHAASQKSCHTRGALTHCRGAAGFTCGAFHDVRAGAADGWREAGRAFQPYADGWRSSPVRRWPLSLFLPERCDAPRARYGAAWGAFTCFLLFCLPNEVLEEEVTCEDELLHSHADDRQPAHACMQRSNQAEFQAIYLALLSGLLAARKHSEVGRCKAT